ncbi:MAG: pilus assembly protein [Pirellulaceae bacterium]|jgi:Flp pilus assembly protein TadG|nr:pilus assembly protein [Pirellulaceae bacterium]
MSPAERAQSASSRSRRGTVTVEFALCVSIFFMFVFGMLELSRFIYVQHSVQMVAYEGARAGVTPGATADDVRARVANLMQACGVRVYTMSVSPAQINNLTEDVAVTINCNFNDNSWVPPSFLTNQTIANTITLQHENMAYLRPGDTSLEDIFGNNDNEPTDL